jgi:hypothetical protein
MNRILFGFDVLKTRPIDDEVDSNIPAQFPLPKLYKVFYETFETGYNKMHVPGVLLPDINQVAGMLEQIILSDLDILIYGFLSIKEAKILLDNTYETDDIIHKDYWPIAECTFNKTLLVGISQDNSDAIFLENTSLFEDGSRFKFVAKDIFSFMKLVTYCQSDEIGYGIASYSQLYKNWGEEFWRIRDTNR